MTFKRGMGVLLATGLASVLGCSGVADDETSAEAVTAIPSSSPIKHVVVIVQENHTFDAYFGSYCTGETSKDGTPLKATEGPAACEKAPPSLVGKTTGKPFPPMPLGDISNTAAGDRNHESACEYLEMNCGEDSSKWDDPNVKCKMDRYVDAAGLGVLGAALDIGSKGGKGGAGCGSIRNWVVAKPSEVATYHQYAREGAIGDRYFQPVVGQTSTNDMFLATAQFEFRDNTWFPDVTGSKCQGMALASEPNYHTIEKRTTIADKLIGTLGKNAFGYYHLGFKAMMSTPDDKRDVHACPPTVVDRCPAFISKLPRAPKKSGGFGLVDFVKAKATKDVSVACMTDPSDNPFRYFEQFGDKGEHFDALHDYDDLKTDIQAGKLPAVTFVKATTAVDEHPAFGPVSIGQTFVQDTVDAVLKSKYADDTLVLITWDEGGGFYDHVAPPVLWDPHGGIGEGGLHTNSEDPAAKKGGWMRLGTRVPIIALGKFAKKNYVSHDFMEHSSIVKFLEWNFLDGKTGQLNGRESQVNNIGSLLRDELNVPKGDAVPYKASQ